MMKTNIKILVIILLIILLVMPLYQNLSLWISKPLIILASDYQGLSS